MILDANQLAAVRQRNDEKLRQGGGGRGYPARTILDLLHTVEAMKQEKRKWKKLAQERGRALDRIAALLAATAAATGAAAGEGDDPAPAARP